MRTKAEPRYAWRVNSWVNGRESWRQHGKSYEKHSLKNLGANLGQTIR